MLLECPCDLSPSTARVPSSYTLEPYRGSDIVPFRAQVQPIQVYEEGIYANCIAGFMFMVLGECIEYVGFLRQICECSMGCQLTLNLGTSIPEPST